MTPKIILDCDPGHDDAMAILMAGRHTDLLGITTVSGNAPLSMTTPNALMTAQILDLDVEVHAGADRPLVAPAKHATEVHGATGLDGPVRPQLDRGPTSHDAVRFIIETLRSTNDVWLVPIGPLTNIALAFRQAPDIIERVAGISIMGGSATFGNVTSTAEFNVWADPEAAAVVFESGAHISMAGLNVTHQYYVDREVISELREMSDGGRHHAATFAADLFDFYVGSYMTRTGKERVALHDPVAVMAVTHPELLEMESRHVVVEIAGKHTRGMTVVDERGFGAASTNCDVGYSIDRDKAMRLFLDTIATYT